MLCVCVLQDDYRRGVDEYDEKVFVSFKLILRELRNIYVSISVRYCTTSELGLGDRNYHYAKLFNLCSSMTLMYCTTVNESAWYRLEYSYAAIGIVGIPIALTYVSSFPNTLTVQLWTAESTILSVLTQVVLYDLILKNHEKLVHPRNSNTSSLY